MKCGLLYLSQESCLIGDVSYHNYEGLIVEKAEWESLSRDLGVHNKVMLLRNHGAVCCGETIEEAFYYAQHLVLGNLKVLDHFCMIISEAEGQKRVLKDSQKSLQRVAKES